MTTHPVPTPSADELVRRLREIGNHGDNITYPSRSSAQRLRAICSESAARILALESQLARMGEALRQIESFGDVDAPFRNVADCIHIAAEATSSTPVQPETKP